jgi:hypothetical protein
MTEEEIHNIYLHMSGKAEGIAESTGAADFPVLFANAILEYTKRPWVGLTDEEIWSAVSRVGTSDSNVNPYITIKDARAIEGKLKEKNHD